MKVWIIEDKGPEHSDIVGVFTKKTVADKWSKRLESFVDNSGVLIGSGYPVAECEVDDDTAIRGAWEMHKRWRKEKRQ